jgi:hypothetical protein
VSDPYSAAPKHTQRLVVVALVALYGAYLLITGGGGVIALPIGVFLLLAVGYVGWDWLSSRGERPPG